MQTDGRDSIQPTFLSAHFEMRDFLLYFNDIIILFAVSTQVCFSTPDTFPMALRYVTLIITRIIRTAALHLITLKVKSRLSMYLYQQKMSSQSKR